MIGAYLSVSIVSLVVIGYNCNHLDGQLNWQVFTHCIISRATELSTVQSVICGMAHLIENIISNHYVPDYIIMDQDSAFMSSLMNYMFKKLDIKIKTDAPYNHHSLQAGHGIKSFLLTISLILDNLLLLFIM